MIYIPNRTDETNQALDRDSLFPHVKDILETMTQVSGLEQHSTKAGLSRMVTVMQPKYRA